MRQLTGGFSVGQEPTQVFRHSLPSSSHQTSFRMRHLFLKFQVCKPSWGVHLVHQHTQTLGSPQPHPHPHPQTLRSAPGRAVGQSVDARSKVPSWRVRCRKVSESQVSRPSRIPALGPGVCRPLLAGFISAPLTPTRARSELVR